MHDNSSTTYSAHINSSAIRWCKDHHHSREQGSSTAHHGPTIHQCIVKILLFESRIDALILNSDILLTPTFIHSSAVVTYAAAIGGGVGGGVLVFCLICCVCACTIYCCKTRRGKNIEGNYYLVQPFLPAPTSTTQVPSDGAKIIIIQENKGHQQPTMTPPLYYAPDPHYYPEPYPAPLSYGMGAPEQYPQSYTDPTSFPQGPPYASAP